MRALQGPCQTPFRVSHFAHIPCGTHRPTRDTLSGMSQPTHSSPNINIVQSPDYRDGYANSVQVRASVWDFLLVFGAARQDEPSEVVLRNFQGIYLSPQQAKALWNLLGQNLAQYEQAFGAITLEPAQAFPVAPTGNGPIH